MVGGDLLVLLIVWEGTGAWLLLFWASRSQSRLKGVVMGAVEDARFGGIDLLPYGRFDEATGTPYSLVFSMLDVAVMTGQLWDRLLTPSQRDLAARGMGLPVGRARGVVALLGGLQELGKLEPAYQRRQPRVWTRLSPQLTAEPGPADAPVVERMSMHLAVGLLADMGFAVGGNASPAVRASQVVGSGGGVFLQVDVAGAASPKRVEAVAGAGPWQQLRARYAGLLRHLVGAADVPVRFSVAAAVLAAGLVQVAARLAGQRSLWTTEADMPAFGAGEHQARAVERCAEHLAGRGWDRVDLPEIAFAAAHPNAGTPNVAQRSLLDTLPGLVDAHGAGILIVRDATGTGKSISALEAARVFNERLGTRGVLWLMPTTATADASWETLDRYVRAHRLEDPVPVTLAHSYSTLNAAYTDRRTAPSPQDTAGGAGTAGLPAGNRPPPAGPGRDTHPHEDDDGDDGDGDAGDVTAPGGFAANSQSALLAQFCAATIDQALMAVLPVDSSAVRLLAVSGKTVVIDEAHTPAPFSHAQMLRLVTWLGALGAPVVVLSATLADCACDDLAAAYAAGQRTAVPARAGGVPPPGAVAAPPGPFRPHDHDGRDEQAPGEHRALDLGQDGIGDDAPAYPGWLFVDAAGRSHRMPAVAVKAHAAAQQRRLRLRLHPVRRRPFDPNVVDALWESTAGQFGPGDRLGVIADLLDPVVAGGGCASVSCATVTDAQDTYRHLQARWPLLGADLMLLHARFPGHLRSARVAGLRAALGRGGHRPHRLVIVTTSLLDTSIDIDWDLMISDLASMAVLLQRLGRLARFHLPPRPTGIGGPVARPPWWKAGHVPAFHVLQPVGDAGTTAVPASWRTIEPAVLLQATAALLTARGSDLVRLPEDVQDLIEAVHGEAAAFTGAGSPLAAQAAALHHRQISETHLSALHLVPPPARISSLADLHRQHLTTAQAATRLGTLPARLLPCYLRPDGRPALDRAGTHLLPDTDRLRRDDIRRLLAHTLPVPAAWVAARTHRHRPPAAWQRYPVLRDLVLLPAPADDRQHTEHFGPYRLRMDDDLGLVTTRTTPRATTGTADAPTATATAGAAQHRWPQPSP